jgi:asparagine N-glycosylation enzyme membrane subunit Stt3
MSEALQKLKSLFLEKQAPAASETVKLGIPRLKNTNLYYWLALIPVFALALFIRTRNLILLKGKYLIELDSYFFFRYAKMLLEQGSVPAWDYMRYVPIGITTRDSVFFPKTMVFFYKIIHVLFTNLSQIEWHVIYPPVITIVSFVFFFLFVKELLNYKTAFIATAFLAVIPAYIQRTSAGFADHESFAMLWMFISLWLFVVAWKSEDWKKYLPIATVSGIFAGMVAGTWGGYLLFIISISLFVLVYAFFNPEIKNKYAFQFICWAAAYLIIGGMALQSFNLRWLAKLTTNFIPLFTMLFLIVHISLRKRLQNFKIKIPAQVLTICIALIIGLVAGLLTGLLRLQEIIIRLTTEGQARLFFTISENAAPYFFNGGWWDSFGWIFLLAFAGSAIYFYKIFKPVEKTKLKLYWLAAAAYVVFILAFIFGRLSPSSKLPALVDFFSNTYLYWLAGFAALLACLYLLAYFKDNISQYDFAGKWHWFLLAMWLLVVLLAARGQIRLLFAATPPIAIASAIFVSEIMDFAKNQQSKIKYAILAGLILFSVFAFATATYQTETENKYSASMTPGQWGNAMDWVRNNTAEDAVFTHWWDYGYLTLAVGERACVTDGGNAMDWNHQSGRYFLTGKDDNSTLTYLKSHNVTHILISEEEIMKYHAFSLVGSDETLDRSSTIGAFSLQQQKEVRDGTLVLYTGSWQLDKEYVIGKLVLSEKNAGIGGFSFVLQNNTIIDPKAYVISTGQQLELPISCVIVQGQRLNFEANDSLAGCLMVVPYFDSSGQGNPAGGAFWMSEKVWDTNFAKLYMYDELSPYFKLIYSDDTPLGIYNGRVIGPIKIWEVNYPENIKPDPFYVQKSSYG